MTFQYVHPTGRQKRVVAENAEEARNRLNAWCANEGQSLDGWELVGVEMVSTALPVSETRDGDA